MRCTCLFNITGEVVFAQTKIYVFENTFERRLGCYANNVFILIGSVWTLFIAGSNLISEETQWFFGKFKSSHGHYDIKCYLYVNYCEILSFEKQ